MLEVKNLSKRFGEKTVLHNVSFSLPAGKTLVILGDNGAGKSTLLQILAAMLSPDGGELRFDGTNLLTDPKSFRRRMNYIPQEPALYEDLSVGENLRFWADMSGLSAAEQRETLPVLAQRFGLTTEEKTTVRKLSGGMKRRLNLCIGLFREPELLLLDEPTAHVDAKTRTVILEALQGLKQAGKTIVYVTHLREEARHLADFVLLLDEGGCAYFGGASDFFEGEL